MACLVKRSSFPEPLLTCSDHALTHTVQAHAFDESIVFSFELKHTLGWRHVEHRLQLVRRKVNACESKCKGRKGVEWACGEE